MARSDSSSHARRGVAFDGTGEPQNEWERRYQASLRAARGTVVAPDNREYLVAVGRLGFPRDVYTEPDFTIIVRVVSRLVWVGSGRQWKVGVYEWRGEIRSPRRCHRFRFGTRTEAEKAATSISAKLASGIPL